MRVIITGGTGLIGRSLVELLARGDYEIIVVSRDPAHAAHIFQQRGLANIQTVGWGAQTDQEWGKMITAESVLVNLAGASPAHWRWTPAYRRRILESRLSAGQAVMQAIKHYGPPAVLLQASATGYYGDRGQQRLTEESTPGQGFRARVCQEWEASTNSVETRRCILRTGLVLDTHEGACPPLFHFAQLLGNHLGDGQQWMPWIHKTDVARAIQFLFEQPMLSGPFNLCAPEPVTNREFIREVQHILKRFPLFPLPAFALRILLGELSTVMLDSQRVLPQRLMQAHFQFAYPRPGQALHHLLKGDLRK